MARVLAEKLDRLVTCATDITTVLHRRSAQTLVVYLSLAYFSASVLTAGSEPTLVTVCPSGCDHTSIQLAVFGSNPGDTVLVNVDGEHTEGPIQIIKDLTIQGLGRGATIVQQAATLPQANRSVFLVGLDATVTVRDMTIRHGFDPMGGCIINLLGHLTLLDVDVLRCETDTNGGAILNQDRLTLQGVTISESVAGASGGGIHNDGGQLAIELSSIIDNTSEGAGGGIYNDGTAEIHLSEISRNTAVGWGGGIFNAEDRGLLIDFSRIDDNRVNWAPPLVPVSRGGGIFNAGEPAQVSRTTFSRNIAGNGGGAGGAIHLAASGSLSIEESSLTDNIAAFGAGIYAFGSLSLSNSTLSGNDADVDGGGLYSSFTGVVTLTNVTVTDNSVDADEDGFGGGGGIYNVGFASVANSLFSANEDRSPGPGSAAPDCFGVLDSVGYNLVADLGQVAEGGDPACEIAGNVTGNTIGQPADLGPLNDNGGPTWTHALLPGSLGIDTGDPAGCFSHDGVLLDTDQRGFFRQDRCDRGAFELGAVDPDLIFGDGFESGSTSQWSK